jgi:hypothetical protein
MQTENVHKKYRLFTPGSILDQFYCVNSHLNFHFEGIRLETELIIAQLFKNISLMETEGCLLFAQLLSAGLYPMPLDPFLLFLYLFTT